tara:strand:+ start:276 stop:566 length:291 start_codon:yes stop_codon:yes gene_type:complete
VIEVLEFEYMNQKQKPTDVFLITKEFNTPTQFSQFIEEQAIYSDSSCMDILIDYCMKNEIEIESVGKLLSATLKCKLETEAKDLHLLKGTTEKLPF